MKKNVIIASPTGFALWVDGVQTHAFKGNKDDIKVFIRCKFLNSEVAIHFINYEGVYLRSVDGFDI